jgi:hypothetical protein
MTAPFWVEIAVAVHAKHVGVDGRVVGGHVDEHRHFLTATGTREFRVIVTPEAIVVVLGRCEGDCQQQTGGGKQPALSLATLERSGAG